MISTGGVDLHIHSSYSEDGDYSVDHIFKLAVAHDLAAIALTDHDTLSQITPAFEAAKLHSIEAIPALEITTIYPEDLSQQHILCYFADPSNASLISLCEQTRRDRMTLALERLAALEKIGLRHNSDLFNMRCATASPTATSVILSILEHSENRDNPLLAGYFNGDKSGDRIMTFYRDFLGRGKPGFVPFRSIGTRNAVETVLSSGALPVLAHPIFAKDQSILNDIISYGIIGIEVWSSYHSEDDTRKYIDIASKHGLIGTAGSDFHGPTAKPGVPFASVTGEYNIVEALKEKRERM
jgi:predicted metal-dependent phosphoesterase TrpH